MTNSSAPQTVGSDLIKTLATRIASSRFSDQDKVTLLTMLGEGRLSIVEAELDNLTLFIGFRPDPTVPLGSSPRMVMIPRTEFPSDTKISEDLKVLRTLKAVTRIKFNVDLRPDVFWHNPWTNGWGIISWYSYIRDEVSIYFPDTGGFKVVSRKDLLQNGSGQNGNPPPANN